MIAKHEHVSASHIPAAFGPVAKFLGWWAGLFGFIAAGGGSVCPCCGTIGCPAAPLAAGVLGGVVTLLLFLPRWLLKLLKRKSKRAVIRTEVHEHPQ